MGVQVTLPQQGYRALRRWPRYEVDVPVRLISHRPTETVVVEGRGRELGPCGMAVFVGLAVSRFRLARTPSFIEEQVEVEFAPPYGGQPTRVRGLIRNRHGYTFGIEFIKENAADYDEVGRLKAILKTLGSEA